MGTAIDVRGSRFLVSTSGPDHMYHLPLHQDQLSEHAGTIGSAWGGVLRGQCRYQTPHPQRCATTALRAKADAMALWDDDPDPKPAPVPLV